MTLSIGFIGYGNMAQAIAKGLVAAGVVQGTDIVACAAHMDKLKTTIAEVGGQALESAADVVNAADVIVVAVKPYLVESVLKPVADELKDDSTFVVSVAAGWTLAKYQEILGNEVHVQCTIPNTPMAVGKGVLITEDANSLTDEQTKTFESLFAPVSLIERVDSDHMTIGMVISGCAPAFTDMYLESLADAGVKYGLQRATAYRLAAKMMEGVGALYLETGEHPGVMKDAVCSPGGTTIKGVASLEKHSFRGAIIDAVDAIVDPSSK